MKETLQFEDIKDLKPGQELYAVEEHATLDPNKVYIYTGIHHDDAIDIKEKGNENILGEYYCFRFYKPTTPEKMILTWEIAQLLPKGIELEVAETFGDSLKKGDKVKFLHNIEGSFNYVVITNEHYRCGHFYPKQFYIPDVQEGTELFHLIEIHKHKKELEKIQLQNAENVKKKKRDEFTTKAQELKNQYEISLENLQKEYQDVL